jgi:hypothetical protein
MLVILTCGSIAAQYRPRQFVDLCFVTIDEFSSSIGLSQTRTQYAHSMIGFTTIQGIQLNRLAILAMGTGLSFYNGGSLVPLFADMRFNCYNYNKYTVYIYGDGGFLFKISNKIEYSKLFINSGVGLKYELSRNLAGNFSLGLFEQQGPRRDSFINLKLGILFLPQR